MTSETGSNRPRWHGWVTPMKAVSVIKTNRYILSLSLAAVSLSGGCAIFVAFYGYTVPSTDGDIEDVQIVDKLTGEAVAGAKVGFAAVRMPLERSTQEYVDATGGLKLVTSDQGTFQFCIPAKYIFAREGGFTFPCCWQYLPNDVWIFIVEKDGLRDEVISMPMPNEFAACDEQVTFICYFPIEGERFRIQYLHVPVGLSGDCPAETENLLVFEGSR